MSFETAIEYFELPGERKLSLLMFIPTLQRFFQRWPGKETTLLPFELNTIC